MSDEPSRKVRLRTVEYDGDTYAAVADILSFLLDESFTDEEKIQGMEKILALGQVANLDQEGQILQ